MHIAAIVVTYNPEEYLLRQQKEVLLNEVDWIIYVDNGTQNTPLIDSLASEGVVIVRNIHNLGLAKAQNQGIAKARERGVDFIVMFDQDSIPPHGFIQGLMDCYESQRKNYKVALVGPVIKNLINESKGNSKGSIFKGLSIKFVEVNKATEVSYCIASGSLIPIKVIDDVGDMNEMMFIDGLDVEWCFRATNKGYKIFQTNNTYLQHCLGDGTSRRVLSHSPKREYYIIRNAIWMSKQSYVPMGYRLRKALLSSGRLILSLASMRTGYIRADLQGIIDGIKM